MRYGTATTYVKNLFMVIFTGTPIVQAATSTLNGGS